MAPSYVRNYIHDHGLTAPDQDVFDCLRDKIARLYLDSIAGFPGRVMNVDACRLLEGRSIKPATIDLVITSPPYLNVVNYGTSNWIRLWWLGLDEVGRHAGAGRRSLNAKLDHQHNYDSYRNFMLAIFRGVRRVLKHKGIAVFVIGDVASPGGESLALARQLWTDIGDETGLRLVEFIEDALPLQSKVSRIWGETKGRATDRDCVLVVGRDDNSWVSDLTDIDWAEPYKDGGPDIAHARLRMRRR
ncbi:MAG: DNA methyltransferase [Acidimicrobiales bacterium]|jgi:site-specific DNA-methyltransferase (adenine-specific)